jgi:Restriction endonuclease
VDQNFGKYEEVSTSPEITDSSPYIYTLGVKLEDFVEKILLKQGYTSTEKRQKLRGVSQALNEIDILARKGGRLIAIESKNYGEARIVHIKEIRDFHRKLQDLPQIHDGMFVTNARFSSEAEQFAKYNRVVLWDGEKLNRIHYLMEIGRFETLDRDIELPAALPIIMSFDEFAKISLVNPLSLTLTDSKMTFLPYYLVEYALPKPKSEHRSDGQQQSMLLSMIYRWKDLTYTKPNGNTINQNYEDYLHFVDAISSKILQYYEIDETKTRELLLSKTNKPISDTLVYHENNQILSDLRTIQPIQNYKLKQTGEYVFEIKDAQIHQSAAERIVLEQVVEETKLKHHEVIIKKSLLIFVPIWSATIESKNKDNHYLKRTLAASRTKLYDEMELCSKDYSSSVFRKAETRKTFAACEHCGLVLCREHILPFDGRYLCAEHTKSTAQTNIESTSNMLNVFKSKFRLKAPSLYNTDKIENDGSTIKRNASSPTPLTSPSSGGKTLSAPKIKNDTRISSFGVAPSGSSDDLHKAQETINREDHEEALPPKKITRYTSDGKPLES